MSRERSVDPGVWSSEQFCDVSRDARMLFLGIVTQADDCGFFPASGHTLKVEVFPSDNDLDKAAVTRLRDELVGVGLVSVYEAGDTAYVWVPTFFEWQRLRWRSKSKRLQRLVEAGVFTLETDDRGQVTACAPILSEPDRSGQVQTESGEKRREDKRGEESPPLRLCRRAGKQGDVHEATTGIINAWNGYGDFRAKDKLWERMRKADAELLLAHVLEVDKFKPDEKHAALLSRLTAKGKSKRKPSDTAIRAARKRLYGDHEGEPRGGPPSSLDDAIDDALEQ